MPDLTPGEFCQAHGISRMTLSRWRHAGRIVVTSTGAIDGEATATLLRASGLGRYRRGTGGDRNLAEAQRVREISLARKRQGEYRRRTEQWVPSGDVALGWAAIREHAIDRIERLPLALAPALVACRSPGAAVGVIRDGVHAVLGELAGTVVTGDPACGPVFDAPVGDGATKLAAETAKTNSAARSNQLDVDVAEGRVVPYRGLVLAMSGCFYNCRSRLLQLESTLPPLCVGHDQEAIEVLLGEGVAEALRELPETLRVPAS